jgi:hypothetical protein
MPKQRTTDWMPNYMPSDEERKWYEYGIKKEIKISPRAAEQGINPKKWYIEIFSKNKWVRSPHVYDKQTIWPEFYKMYKYYYDKHR